MPKPLEQKLREKGWSDADIQHALSVLGEGSNVAEINVYANKINPVVYWTALVMAIAGNIFIAVLLIPFLLFLQSTQLFLLMIVLGISFGLLFNFILKDIELVDPSHHIIAEVFIPALGIITIFIMITIANQLSFRVDNPIHQNPVLVSVIYIAAFILPYAVFRLYEFFKGIKISHVET